MAFLLQTKNLYYIEFYKHTLLMVALKTFLHYIEDCTIPVHTMPQCPEMILNKIEKLSTRATKD